MLVGDLVFGLVAVVGVTIANSVLGLLLATLGINLQNLLGLVVPGVTV